MALTPEQIVSARERLAQEQEAVLLARDAVQRQLELALAEIGGVGLITGSNTGHDNRDYIAAAERCLTAARSEINGLRRANKAAETRREQQQNGVFKP